MKVLIVSDTHKHHENLIRVLEREQNLDLMIHLGDAEGYEDDIADMAGCPLEIVAGNNDFFSTLPREKVLQIGKYKVLITHGHYYYVSSGVEDIIRDAAGRGMDVVMFGHTHRPLIERMKGVIALNPGSLTYPRQEGKKPSYALMEIDKKGEAHFAIEYLE
ncbi:MAG: metallophosphoesterase [Clostridiales bacterium]|uniref:metallophosphoesterase family protein n=1 Tax=Roseburia sp. MSJ-14 TaxID=2841514 RepID=UPI0016B7F651|nr:metallophosphoesterase [Roseburia sp. MSJ-14]MBU5474060.1 metallophosphoesterase [Roseburia sp. MSJ-14]NLK77524.1 metallophosphoesterase [Clostridiales bacterium]